MATNVIIGKVYRVMPTEAKPFGDKTFYERTIIIDATRFDPYTGESSYPSFPQFTVSGEDRCTDLDGFAAGSVVQVSFDIQGAKYADKNTGEEKFFNRVRAYKIEPYERARRNDFNTASAAQNVPPIPEKEPDFMPEANNEVDDLPFS